MPAAVVAVAVALNGELPVAVREQQRAVVDERLADVAFRGGPRTRVDALADLRRWLDAPPSARRARARRGPPATRPAGARQPLAPARRVLRDVDVCGAVGVRRGLRRPAATAPAREDRKGGKCESDDKEGWQAVHEALAMASSAPAPMDPDGHLVVDQSAGGSVCRCVPPLIRRHAPAAATSLVSREGPGNTSPARRNLEWLAHWNRSRYRPSGDARRVAASERDAPRREARGPQAHPAAHGDRATLRGRRVPPDRAGHVRTPPAHPR
jgi:hypothetical protein